LKSLLERWNPDTNTFLFQSGERTVTLLDMNKLAGLSLEGEFYEEFIPPLHEQDPSTT
jgi:peptide alpha-N-acetyltransferase